MRSFLVTTVLLLGCSKDELPSSPPATPWYEKSDFRCTETEDSDGDGWCAQIDCDDANPETHPAAIEVCDGVDNDCDTLVDADVSVALAETYYLDRDGDGVGSTPLLACRLPEGYAAVGGDCDDMDDAVHPDADEVCGDGIDNDCADGDAAC